MLWIRADNKQRDGEGAVHKRYEDECAKVNLTFSKLCLREEHLFSHNMAASNAISSLGTLRKSLARISVSLSTQRDKNSSWW